MINYIASPVPFRTLGPFEYDDYYNTRVNRPWARTKTPIVIGIFLILLGLLAIIFTSYDLICKQQDNFIFFVFCI
jgi:hypothetical protein